LVHLEVTGRRERRIQRRIQDARFPRLKTLDAFSFEAQPDLDRDAVLQVFDCSFVADAATRPTPPVSAAAQAELQRLS
jgi:DNA replication protein DnaC